MQFALKQTVVPSPIVLEVELDLSSDVDRICRIRESILDNGFCKEEGGTLVVGGCDLANEGIYLRKQGYEIRRINVFKDKYFDHIFDIFRYKQQYRQQIRDLVYRRLGIGGVNELFIRILRHQKIKRLYRDDWVSVNLYFFSYRAQINGYGQFISPPLADYLEQYSSHSRIQRYVVIIYLQGRGRIEINENTFSGYSSTKVHTFSCDGEMVLCETVERKCLAFFEVQSEQVVKYKYVFDATDFLMVMKRLRIEFFGHFNIVRLTVSPRVWKTPVCLSYTNECYLGCVNDRRECNRSYMCLSTPMSACDICKSIHLKDRFRVTSMVESDLLIQILSCDCDFREGLNALRDDNFFSVFRFRLQDVNQITKYVCEFQRSIGCTFYGMAKIVRESDGKEINLLWFSYCSEEENIDDRKESFVSKISTFYKTITKNQWVILYQHYSGQALQEYYHRMATKKDDILG